MRMLHTQLTAFYKIGPVLVRGEENSDPDSESMLSSPDPHLISETNINELIFT